MWTKDKPTLEGFYWVKGGYSTYDIGPSYRLPQIVHVGYDRWWKSMMIHVMGWSSEFHLEAIEGAEWYGPLPVPENGGGTWRV